MRKIALAFLLTLAACTDPERSRETLENLGFTEIETMGYAPFSCGEDYTYATEFRAKNVRGQRVEGVVCCGFLKGCTPKF